MRVRRRLETVEARQFNKNDADGGLAVAAWAGGHVTPMGILIPTGKTKFFVIAEDGDWILSAAGVFTVLEENEFLLMFDFLPEEEQEAQTKEYRGISFRPFPSDSLSSKIQERK